MTQINPCIIRHIETLATACCMSAQSPSVTRTAKQTSMFNTHKHESCDSVNQLITAIICLL